MKRFLCLVLVLVLAMSVFSACSSNEEAVADDKPVQSKDESTEAPSAEVSASGTVTPKGDSASTDSPSGSSPDAESSNPAVYLAMDATDNEVKISYHLEGCSATKGLTVQEIDWNTVTTLGFRQCQKCKPPKYEGYID